MGEGIFNTRLLFSLLFSGTFCGGQGFHGGDKVMTVWLSATGGQGGGPQKRLLPPKMRLPPKLKTIERTMETIAYCLKNNGILSSPFKFFQAESQ